MAPYVTRVTMAPGTLYYESQKRRSPLNLDFYLFTYCGDVAEERADTVNRTGVRLTPLSSVFV